MCGIAGAVSYKNTFNEIVVQGLTRNLSHRGPDDEGIEVITPHKNKDKNILFIHCRLTIIDLSKLGHQPMRDEETGNWIVYNGEIYNFKTLRKQLEIKGIKFRSQSDTEVILKAYAVWGIKCLDYLCGMFAFAIWDEKAQSLFIARDRLGIKPLYYYTDDKGLFIFASELKALLSTGLVPRKIDPSGLESYLAYGAIQAPLTIIKGVYSLLPAYYMVIDPDGKIVNSQCYWQIPFSSSNNGVTGERELIHDLYGILENVVTEHLVSDVPVGAFLSGGIDSSSIVALMNKVAPEQVNTFSVIFAEEEFSEAPYSRLIAEKYSKHHTEICLTGQQLLTLLPDALAAMDQPTIDGVNVYVISKVIRERGIKVVLSGQGGDEIFAGYPSFGRIQQINRYKLFFKFTPQIIRKKITELWGFISDNGVAKSKISEILKTDGNILSVYQIMRQLFLPEVRKSLFPHDARDILINGLPVEVASRLQDKLKNLDPINQVSLLESELYLANMLLRDGDFMSMAHGLEIRVPFIDHRLVEYIARIPGGFKVDKSLPKPLLLKAMGDMLPTDIYRRPKSGFTFPWELWLRNELRSDLSILFDSPDVGANIGLNPSACRNLWQSFLNNEPAITWSRIWGLFVLIKWSKGLNVTL